MGRSDIGAWALLALALLACTACESERTRVFGQGVHPIGWPDPGDPAFHGDFMRAQGYPLDECRSCHGQDFAGGDADVSCSDADACHPQGVEACNGTCHGELGGPRPDTGAHPAHAPFCATCHPIPESLTPPHVDLVVNVDLVDLAATGGRAPTYDPQTQTCSDTYCHQGESPPWTSDQQLDCNGCHQQSPTHDRFDRVVGQATCGNCHADSPSVGHIDGQLVISVTGCNGCHGTSPNTGAPPNGLDGATAPSAPSVGAHRRHLDSLLSGRIGKVVACNRCHDVPGEVLADGHLDSTAPADVDVVLGDYDPATRSCVVDCHFDRDPGPVWTDDSGAARACDACHAFPPVLTRIGTRHPTTPPDTAACAQCHAFSPTTHVDGEVTFL